MPFHNKKILSYLLGLFNKWGVIFLVVLTVSWYNKKSVNMEGVEYHGDRSTTIKKPHRSRGH